MNWHDRLAQVFLDRRANIGINLTLSVLFAALAYYADTWWGSVLCAWSSGAQGGFAMMWFIGPTINARWKTQMEAEIAIMTAAVFARILREAAGIEPEMVVPSRFQSPPTAPLH